MIFNIPKEIASENKLWKSIYIKYFVIILGVLFFTWITSSLIYSSLNLLYYLFTLSMTLLLISKSSHNPNKRVYEAIYILFKKNNFTYHSIDFNKDGESDV